MNTAIGTLYLYFVLTLIGAGPAWVLAKKNSVDTFAYAPLCALILTTLVGTYLVFFNFKVSDWATAWTMVGTTLSLVLIVLNPKKGAQFQFDRVFLLLLCGFFLNAVLLCLPAIIGGLKFTILRGNGIDDFNYLAMAGLLKNEPYAWAKNATSAYLLAKNPTFPWAQMLLKTRWSTSMLLAWSSCITQLPLFRLEHGFTLLFFMMLYSIGFSIARLLSFKPYQALLIALTLSLGFWGQLVLDLRAMSQISILPILLWIATLLIKMSARPTFTQTLLFSMTLAAVGLLYIEIVPFIIFAIIIWALIQKWQRSSSIKTLTLTYLTPLLFAAILIAPLLYDYLWHFFINQMRAAVLDQNNWYLAYFHWLYARPLFNFWGDALWANIFIEHTFWFNVFKNLISLLSILLFLIFSYGLVRIVILKQTADELKIMAAFVISGLLAFLYLLSHHQLWAAGKALSYCYPFIVLVLASAGFIVLPRSNHALSLIKAAPVFIIIWSLLQCGLSSARISYAYHQKVYPHYILHHYDYLRHDWDISQLTAFLQQHQIKSLGLWLSNPYTATYFDFNWADNIQIMHIKTLHEKTPNYLIVTKNDAIKHHWAPLAETKEWALINRN